MRGRGDKAISGNCCLPHDGTEGQPAPHSGWPFIVPPLPSWALLLPWVLGTTACLALPCLTDIDGSSSEPRPIEPIDRRLGRGGVWHLDKAKAAGAAGLPLRDEVDVLHLAIRFEELAHLFAGGRVRQTADKNPSGAVLLAAAWLPRPGGGGPAVSAPGHRQTPDAEEQPQIEQDRVDRDRGGRLVLPERALHPLPPCPPPGLVRVEDFSGGSQGQDEYHEPPQFQPLADGCWPHRAFLAVSGPPYRREPSAARAPPASWPLPSTGVALPAGAGGHLTPPTGVPH